MNHHAKILAAMMQSGMEQAMTPAEREAMEAVIKRCQRTQSVGAELIAAERARQVTDEGFDMERDGGYVGGELAKAAAAYALAGAGPKPVAWVSMPPMPAPSFWPWAFGWWKPTTPIRNLQKAGALIAAEIDRRIAAGESP